MWKPLATLVVAAFALPALAQSPEAEAPPPGAEPAGEPLHEDASLRPPPWVVPAVESCKPDGGLRGWPPGQDAPPLPFDSGDVFGIDKIEALKDFLPQFVWENRDRFFYEGMQLEIGRCFADYSPPEFFRTATANHFESVRLTEAGGIENYTAGLPFPAERIAAGDPEAGLKWGWNFELRYQGAGFWGKFRTSDMVGRDGRAEPFIGEIFRAQTAFRADRPDDDYVTPGAKGKHWVGGGLMAEPFDARHYAWRQYRDIEHLTEAGRTDDLHAYLPDFRRVRRVPATGVEGVYMPSFSVGVVKPQTVAVAAGGVGGGGAGAAVGASVASSITTKRSGFEGLELRPVLYTLRAVGVHDVLTPINASSASYPTDTEREFGPWGLSFASDRWDLRRAVVIEGVAREQRGGEQVQRFIQYVDAQTLAPLYYASWDSRGEQIDVGMFVGRWSEERKDYPRWPDDDKRPIRVIDSVGASFANLSEDGGWRRESWEIVSTPPDDRTLKRLLSVSDLTKQN